MSFWNKQTNRSLIKDTTPRSTRKVDLNSYRAYLPKKEPERSRINLSLNKSNSNSESNPLALHINIDKQVMNTTIVMSSKSLEKSNRITRFNPVMRVYNTEQKSNIINEKKVLTPREALKIYNNQLTEYEKGEIIEYSQIYFVSTVTKRHEQQSFSDSKKYYNIIINDQIAYRYEILEYIGKGSFGQALKCFDHKEKQIVALKILRCKKKLYKQGMIEANILKFIKNKDIENKTHIVRIIDCFTFRMHIMITTELLSINLYTLLSNNNFNGVSIRLIRHFAIQLIEALSFLKNYQIIHCDLKPENILLEQPNKSAIKLIDFGSSCFSDEKVYNYIQSRFYRAPEIILGISYTTSIDMWSLGCILAELYIGYPIFPGESEPEQMSMIMEVIGVPPDDILDYSPRRGVFFDEEGSPYLFQSADGKIRIPGSKALQDILHCPDTSFIDFIKRCLVWDPEKRLTPEAAKLHPWVSLELNTKKVEYSRNNKLTLNTKHSLDTNRLQDSCGNISLKNNLLTNKHKDTLKTFIDENEPTKPIFKKLSNIRLKNFKVKKVDQKSFEHLKKNKVKGAPFLQEPSLKLVTARTNKPMNPLFLKLLS